MENQSFSAELEKLRKKFEPRIDAFMKSAGENCAASKQMSFASAAIRGELPFLGKATLDFVGNFLNAKLPDLMFPPTVEDTINLVSSDEEDDYDISSLARNAKAILNNEISNNAEIILNEDPVNENEDPVNKTEDQGINEVNHDNSTQANEDLPFIPLLSNDGLPDSLPGSSKTPTIREEVDMEMSDGISDTEEDQNGIQLKETEWNQPQIASTPIKKVQKRVTFDLGHDNEYDTGNASSSNQNTSPESYFDELDIQVTSSELEKSPEKKKQKTHTPNKGNDSNKLFAPHKTETKQLLLPPAFAKLAEKARDPSRVAHKPINLANVQKFTEEEKEKLERVRQKLKQKWQIKNEQDMVQIKNEQDKMEKPHIKNEQDNAQKPQVKNEQDNLHKPQVVVCKNKVKKRMKHQNGNQNPTKKTIKCSTEKFISSELKARLVRDRDDARAERLADTKLTDDNYEIEEEYREYLNLLSSPEK